MSNLNAPTPGGKKGDDGQLSADRRVFRRIHGNLDYGEFRIAPSTALLWNGKTLGERGAAASNRQPILCPARPESHECPGLENRQLDFTGGERGEERPGMDQELSPGEALGKLRSQRRDKRQHKFLPAAALLGAQGTDAKL